MATDRSFGAGRFAPRQDEHSGPEEEESIADDVTPAQQRMRRAPQQDTYTSLSTDFRRLQDHFGDLMTRLREEGKSIHQQKAELGLILERERQQLKDELAAERQNIEKEKSQLAEMREKAERYSDERSVKLNVGGTVFSTTVATLSADPKSMLSAMFAEAFYIQRNDEGEVLIDRDPKHFSLILEHLRMLRAKGTNASKSEIIPSRAYLDEVRTELLAEAEFFGLQILFESLRVSSLVVSAEATSKYKRVSDALQDARDGDCIVVRPGVYYDSFTLLHNVEIAGEGPRESIVIRSPWGNAVECRCPSAVVRGITLECFAPDNSVESVNDSYGVYISEGSLLLEDCEVRCVGLSCIKIVGGAKAGLSTIRRCDIHSANQCGILLANSADALIQHNTIHHNRFSGVEIRNGARPKLQGNRIFENVQNGVYIHSHGEGTVEGNHLYKNKFNGINGEGNVLVTGNVIHENLKRGIFYGTQMTLQGNEVYWNSLGDFAPRR